MTRAEAMAASDLRLAGRCESGGMLYLYMYGADRHWSLYNGQFKNEGPCPSEWRALHDWFPVDASSEVGEYYKYCTDVSNVGKGSFEVSREAFQ